MGAGPWTRIWAQGTVWTLEGWGLGRAGALVGVGVNVLEPHCFLTAPSASQVTQPSMAWTSKARST